MGCSKAYLPPIISAVGRLKQDGYRGLEVILGHIVSSRLVYKACIVRSCLRKLKKGKLNFFSFILLFYFLHGAEKQTQGLLHARYCSTTNTHPQPFIFFKKQLVQMETKTKTTCTLRNLTSSLVYVFLISSVLL